MQYPILSILLLLLLLQSLDLFCPLSCLYLYYVCLYGIRFAMEIDSWLIFFVRLRFRRSLSLSLSLSRILIENSTNVEIS